MTDTTATPSLTEIHARLSAERKRKEADASRAYRARQRAARAEGSPLPRPADVREALADAALIVLATGGPGTEELQRFLALAFPGRPGVAGNVKLNARRGTLKPRVLTPEVLRATAPKPSAFQAAIAEVEAAQQQARGFCSQHPGDAVEETLDAFLLETGDLAEIADEAERRVDQWLSSRP